MRNRHTESPPNAGFEQILKQLETRPLPCIYQRRKEGHQAPQPYNNGYAQQGFNRGYSPNQSRDFDRADRNDNRGRVLNDRDNGDRDRSYGNGENYRQGNGYSNGFRGH